jgi:hypothetical protein
MELTKGKLITGTILALAGITAAAYFGLHRSASCATLNPFDLPVSSSNIESCLDFDSNLDKIKEPLLFTWQGRPELYAFQYGEWRNVSDPLFSGGINHFGDLACGPVVGVISKIVGDHVNRQLVDLSDPVNMWLYQHYTDMGYELNPPAELISRWDGNLNGTAGSLILVKGVFIPGTAPMEDYAPHPLLWWVGPCGSASGVAGMTKDYRTVHVEDAMSSDGSFSLTTPEGLGIKYDAQTHRLTVDGQ